MRPSSSSFSVSNEPFVLRYRLLESSSFFFCMGRIFLDIFRDHLHDGNDACRFLSPSPVRGFPRGGRRWWGGPCHQRLFAASCLREHQTVISVKSFEHLSGIINQFFCVPVVFFFCCEEFG